MAQVAGCLAKRIKCGVAIVRHWVFGMGLRHIGDRCDINGRQVGVVGRCENACKRLNRKWSFCLGDEVVVKNRCGGEVR